MAERKREEMANWVLIRLRYRCKKEKAKVQPDYAMEEESWALEKGKCESLGTNKEGTIEWGDEEMR
jgi:hypothetical protein